MTGKVVGPGGQGPKVPRLSRDNGFGGAGWGTWRQAGVWRWRLKAGVKVQAPECIGKRREKAWCSPGLQRPGRSWWWTQGRIQESKSADWGSGSCSLNFWSQKETFQESWARPAPCECNTSLAFWVKPPYLSDPEGNNNFWFKWRNKQNKWLMYAPFLSQQALLK